MRVAASSDALYAEPDPWQTIHAAATRRVTVRARDEPANAASTLASLLADPPSPRRSTTDGPGQRPGDVVLLHRPLTRVLDQLTSGSASPVRQVFC